MEDRPRLHRQRTVFASLRTLFFIGQVIVIRQVAESLSRRYILELERSSTGIGYGSSSLFNID